MKASWNYLLSRPVPAEREIVGAIQEWAMCCASGMSPACFCGSGFAAVEPRQQGAAAYSPLTTDSLHGQLSAICELQESPFADASYDAGLTRAKNVVGGRCRRGGTAAKHGQPPVPTDERRSG